jgi:hypothetical protein
MSKEKNIAIYDFACEYLKNLLPSDYDKEKLASYFLGESKKALTLREVYTRFIESAQNYQQMPNVIKFWWRIDLLKVILFDFDYQIIQEQDPYELYLKLRDAFSPNSTDSRRNSWYKWSCSVVDSARFISQFRDYEDFDSFVNQFTYNTSTRMALPLLISTKIRGMGFALVCDTLKELGYVDYPKPDIHIIDICDALNLSSRNPSDCFEAICQMAVDNHVSPYRVDKILWLICSGKLYNDGINLGRYKEQFIGSAKQMLITKELM